MEGAKVESGSWHTYRGLTSGLAEWYKGKLAEQQQFAGEGGGGE